MVVQPGEPEPNERVKSIRRPQVAVHHLQHAGAALGKPAAVPPQRRGACVRPSGRVVADGMTFRARGRRWHDLAISPLSRVFTFSLHKDSKLLKPRTAFYDHTQLCVHVVAMACSCKHCGILSESMPNPKELGSGNTSRVVCSRARGNVRACRVLGCTHTRIRTRRSALRRPQVLLA